MDAPTLMQRAEQARHRGDFVQARSLYVQALGANPGNLNLRLDAAAASLACEDAVQAWRLLSELRPSELPSEAVWRFHLCTATTLQRLAKPEEAVSHYARALSSVGIPSSSRRNARQWASHLLLNSLGDPAGAAAIFRTGLGPKEATGAAVPEAFLLDPEAWMAMLVASMYTGAVSAEALVRGFRAFAAAHLMPRGSAAASPPRRRARRSARRRPRIGFVSPMLCASPVGFLTLGTIEMLAHQADLVMFDRGGKTDWAQARFRAAAVDWKTCEGADIASLQESFASAGLDALVDLGGWMDLDVLRALAGRPVERQFKWVGGQSLTSGLSCFDGFWADERQVPDHSRSLYSERVAWLSRGYVTYVSPPYRDLSSAAAHPAAPGPAAAGAYAMVSNPAKIGPRMRARLDELKPRKLYLVDGRWRHGHARRTVERWLGPWSSCVEFISPDHHPQYLEVLSQLDATVIDTEPYSMGLTAIELRLLGKPVLTHPRGTLGTMSEFHCGAHLAADGFDHYTLQAGEILRWCTS
jgi:tetratricopeptide (TPR) repeat protein